MCGMSGLPLENRVAFLPLSDFWNSDEIKNKSLKLKREKRAESCRGKSQDSVSGFCKILLVLTKALATCPSL